MTGRRQFEKSTFRINKQKQDVVQQISGILGFYLDGKEVVEVANKQGYVYVRIRNNLSEVVMAFNDQVKPVFGLPVLIYRDKKNVRRWRVSGKDIGTYNNWGDTPYLPKHGEQHSFRGGDTTWIYSEQFLPLQASPSGTLGSNSLIVHGPFPYKFNGEWKCFDTTGTVNLLDYNPTGTSFARTVLVYLNQETNALDYEMGDYFSDSVTGTCEVMQQLPNLDKDYYLPVVGVRLVPDTYSFNWNNLYDARQWLTGGDTDVGGNATGSYSADLFSSAEGALVVDTNVMRWVVPRTCQITDVKAYVKTKGTAGSTVIDVNRNGTSIFPTATKPTIAYDDADGLDSRVPDTTTLTNNDVITVDIDSIATGAGGLFVSVSTTYDGGIAVGTDTTAIHDDVAEEIHKVSEKGSPVFADEILIEDSAASWAKKKVSLDNLPNGVDGTAIHDNIASEVSSITNKATPTSADYLLIEDNNDGNKKKRITIGNLPKGYVWQTFIFTMEGDLDVGAKPLRIYMPGAYTIDKVFISVNTAPTGQAVIVDVEKNGTTIFTTQANRPSIAASAYTDESGTPNVTALVAGDYLTYSIDQIGTAILGADLTVHVRCKQVVQF